MGNKKNTKSAVILREASDRLMIAEADVRSALEQLRIAEAVRDTQAASYTALAKSLARAAPKLPPSTATQPARRRSLRNKSTDTPPVSSETETGIVTSVGGNGNDDVEGVAGA